MTAPVFGADIRVTELKERMDQGRCADDCRRSRTGRVRDLPASRAHVLIPLQQLPPRLAELDPSKEIVLQCKVGGRSAQRDGVSASGPDSPAPAT